MQKVVSKTEVQISRSYMSLNRDEREIPTQAFLRRMLPRSKTVVDEQTREEYHAELEGEGTRDLTYYGRL